jgi:hypothetical protein
MEYDDEFLRQNGYSGTGIIKFKGTVEEFKKNLFNKSIKIAGVNREKDMPLEITSEIIKDATGKIYHSQTGQKPHPLFIVSKILEYIFLFLATVGGSNFDKNYGPWLLVICAPSALALFAARLIGGKIWKQN